jgi:hypothetical protein
MWEIASSVPQLNDIEVTITAQVGEYYWNEVIEGYSKARIYNSSLRLEFLGGSPQVFKPSMPYTCYVRITFFNSLTDLNMLIDSNFLIGHSFLYRWFAFVYVSIVFKQFRN